jgi:hypothetical protein
LRYRARSWLFLDGQATITFPGDTLCSRSMDSKY